ncbi:hypothetical protein BDB00DRAFT_849422 [Zychaea mexicana]|uniref:uncharacterized protein n=1 Tax=Zychaea mexicana TaxID=64656 RepID=UPI0022FE3380|nr:uncharacterized protein BDB00DRAFT_849422 [Zychaea mexicana]KAI9488224.1 hypothetical protein BDB00DRAFT_849422 [Zychaea mexicana]
MAVAYDWVEVHDPHTKHVYYANPTTGECLWEEKPTVGSIKAPHPDGDWWELWDEKTQLPYYYHTQHNKTQWNKPGKEESTIISLVKIQQSSPGAQKRLSVKEPPPPPWLNSNNDDSSNNKRNSRSLDLEQQNGNIKIAATPQRSTSEETRQQHHHHHHQHAASTSTTMSDNSITSSSGGGGFFGRRARNPPARKSSLKRHSNFFRSRTSIETAFANFTRGSKKTQQQQVSAPINNPEARASMHPLNDNGSMIDTASVLTAPPPPPPNLLAQINNQPISNGESKRMMLPTSLQHDINQFAIDGFAQKYFATHKRGLFRRRVPMKEMLEWTKDSLNKPLMMLNKDLHKDALRCFRMIQMVMGDRHRPRNSSDVEDLQSILSCGITKGQMRDEIYVQVCKQLHNNPRGSSIRKGWEILCIVCITFPPSKNLESYLTHFVQQHHQVTENDVNVMSQHVSNKLKRICIRGAKGKVLTAAEIERAKIAPFKPSVFGEPLPFIMSMEQQREEEQRQQQQQQQQQDGNNNDGESCLQIPRIVPFLADAVIRLNGQQSEGIFRVPGDADDVTELRVRIENGNYDATGITDPNVPASLLKYWIRDLPEPLISMDLYDTCVAYAEDIDKAIDIINSLPNVNRRIVLYILSFLQEFIDPEVIKHTLMNVHNLAMVYAPNLLRCPSEKLTTVLENSKYEQAFLRCLLLQLDADKAACAYDTNSDKAIGSKKEME